MLHAYTGCNQTVFLVPYVPRYNNIDICSIDDAILSITSTAGTRGIYDVIVGKMYEDERATLRGSQLIAPFSLVAETISFGTVRYSASELGLQWEMSAQFYVSETSGDICPVEASGWVHIEVEDLLYLSPLRYNPVVTNPVVSLILNPYGLPWDNNLVASMTINGERFQYQFPDLTSWNYCQSRVDISFPGDFLSYFLRVKPTHTDQTSGQQKVG
jgi:hypothetical protein